MVHWPMAPVQPGLTIPVKVSVQYGRHQHQLVIVIQDHQARREVFLLQPYSEKLARQPL
jgi:hypothetical protein